MPDGDGAPAPDLGTLPPPDLGAVFTDRAPKRARSGGGLTDKAVTDGLAQLYVMGGMLVMFQNAYDGLTIIDKAPAMAASVVAVGKRNKRVWRVLQLLAQGTDVTALVGSHLAVVSAIAANHGAMSWRIPLGLGVTPPDDLEERLTRQTEAAQAAHDAAAQQAYQEQYTHYQESMGAYGTNAVSDAPHVTHGASDTTNGDTANGDTANGANGGGAGGVTSEQLARIVAEAAQNALRERQQAVAQGADGMPNPNHNPAVNVDRYGQVRP